jgi:hypothetical protein
MMTVINKVRTLSSSLHLLSRAIRRLTSFLTADRISLLLTVVCCIREEFQHDLLDAFHAIRLLHGSRSHRQVIRSAQPSEL